MAERNYIGFDPIKWLDRLRDVNATSSFTKKQRDLIDRYLGELQKELES